MYVDLLTHCPDPAALLAEVQAKHHDRVVYDGNNPVGWDIFKAPSAHAADGGVETIAHCRVTVGDLASVRSLGRVEVLAEAHYDGATQSTHDALYDALAANPTAVAIYERVTGLTLPERVLGVI